MNVKANGILAQNSKVKDFFVPLSPGDETNVFGGGYLATEDFFKKNYKNPNAISPLHSVYLGPEFNNQEVEKSIRKKQNFKKFLYL